MRFHDLLQRVVALVHHHEAGDVAIFFKVGGGAFDIREHDHDGASELLQLGQKLILAFGRLHDLGDAIRV